MKMKELQKGDRVRCIDGYYHRLIVGSIYKVCREPLLNGYLPVTDEIGREENCTCAAS
jgi:hypothetical protein